MYSPHRDRRALYSIVQALAADPRVGELRTTVFQLDQRRVLFEQTAGSLNLQRMIEAASKGANGTITLKALAEEGPVDDFLAELVNNAQAERPVPVIFRGPSVQRAEGKNGGTIPNRVGIPVAYINYAPDPHAIVWDDPIQKLTSKLKGTRYLIHRPEDLLRSWNSLFAALLR